ncbi:AAA family ATPase [Paenibacillus sp. ClWae2A]|uniref:ATP-dependent nuclease n=1 Tax=Paenibacillus sp. ClWae2A TaxID=3057177 RepID=UPI0028F59D2C|nr:AAA family ATPase [Paenibacillus sp. ClWae2A]MDT9717922.1 AAA family ATPase [Paenibacillus sp. ClWae2A]
MWLQGISLRGYRSYSNDEGVNLTQFRRMNFFIGPNNVGKSNLVRFIKHLRTRSLFNSIDIDPENNAWDQTNPFFYAEFDFQGESHEDEKKIYIQHMQNEHLILEGIPQSEFGDFMSNHVRIFSDNRGLGSNNSVGYFQPMMDGKPITGQIAQGAVENYKWYTYYKAQMSEHLSILLNEKVELSIKLSLKNKKIEDLDSDEIREIIESRIKHERLFYNTYSVFEPENAEFIVMLIRNGSKKEFSLNDLGLGVFQFVTILSALYTNVPEHRQNIIFEEIELNMHTQALTLLMRILEEEYAFKNFRYFFLTHSTSILDLISKEWSVHAFYRSDDGSTAARLCTKRLDTHRLLDEMGVKPSQLLMSNFVIWVEGPSDKIYLNKWIELKGNERKKKYIEGKHYSFVYYGGALLSHYGILLADDLSEDDRHADTLIDIMNISRYSAIICDSDLGEERQELKNRVEQIQARLNEKTELQSHVFQWITAGREIENYVPKPIFEDVFANKMEKRKRLTFEGKSVKLPEPNNTSIADQNFTSADSFDKFFAQMYLTKEQLDSSYGEFVIKNISSQVDKIDIANHVTSLWQKEDFIVLDLEEKMERLLDFIDKAQN